MEPCEALPANPPYPPAPWAFPPKGAAPGAGERSYELPCMAGVRLRRKLMTNLKRKNKSASCSKSPMKDMPPPRPPPNPWPNSMPMRPAPRRPPRRPRPKPPEKKPPRAPEAPKPGRNIPWFGDVIDRLKGEAPFGAVIVEDGAPNVREPRLPKDPPLPARAKASAEKPAASISAKVKINVLWRIAMEIVSCR
ncbi:conserved hypothetical protein [Methylocella tundrae]|nr:conserved hypothetical protein [Methylocella tundrae]